MTPRISSSAVLVAALLACKNSGPADPEPAMPDAEAQPPFDPAALVDRPGAPPQGPAGAAVAILDYAPQGRTAGGAAIKVRFDRPVVALGSEPSVDPGRFLSFTPPIPGSARFETPDLLVFHPDAELQDATLYTARFAPGLVGLDGQAMAQGVEWTFETPRPQVVEGQPLRDTLTAAMRRDAPFVVTFDHPTTVAQVRAHLQATARPLGREDAKPAPVQLQIREATAAEVEEVEYYGYTATREDRGRYFTIRAGGLWPSDSEIVLAVRPGLVGRRGPLPLETPWEMSFETYSPQAVVSLPCDETTRCGLEPIHVGLRNPVRASQAKHVTVSPRPKSLHVDIADAYDDEGGTEVEIQGQFVPGTVYTISIAPGLRDIYGQTLAGGFKRTVVIERRPELALSSTQGTLLPGRKQTVGVEARFFKSLKVRAAVVDELELARQSWQAMAMPAGASERTVALAPKGPGGWASIALDIGDLVGGKRGAVLVEVAPGELSTATDHGSAGRVRGLYRLTDLGPVVIDSPTRAVVQVLRLSDSTPVAGATVARVVTVDEKTTTRMLGTTDGDGMLALPPVSEYMAKGIVKAGEGSQAQRLVIVDAAGADRTAIAAGEVPAADSLSADLAPHERAIARIVPDRGAYRPGEKVKVVGWAAVETPHRDSGLKHLAQKTEAKFVLTDPRGGEVATRTVKTTAEGKYWAELELPAGAALGNYQLTATVLGADARATVKVEDYRVPEFQVTASVDRTDVLAGERVGLRVAANYYFGGAVPIVHMAHQATCTPHRWRPPGLDSTWAVGESIPYRASGGRGPRTGTSPDPNAKLGMLEVATPLTLHAAEFPHRCTISAEVRDASNQAIGAEAQVQVHPADFYLAMGMPPGYRHTGDRIGVPVRAVGLGGQRVAVRGAKVMVERTWSEVKERAEGGRMVYDGTVDKTERVKSCTLDVAAEGPDVRCELPALKEGSYQLRVEVLTADKRAVASEGNFWVVGATRSKWVPTPQKTLTVETSAQQVTPGESVDVAVHAPWRGGRGVLVLDRKGLRQFKPFTFKGADSGTADFQFTADDSWTPQVHVSAIVVAPIDPKRRPERPEVLSTRTTVTQGSEHRRLQVRVEAPAKAGPGDKVELAAFVRDAAGEPVVGRVALWAVDEAVLALTDYEVPDLLPSFLPGGAMGTRAYNDYSAVLWPYTPVHDDPWLSGTWGYGRGFGSGSGHGSRTASVRGGSARTEPAARERFETTPVFLADLAADADGVVRTKAQLPENLTTFRIFALASARLADKKSPGRFGVGDARTTVTAPFLVRAAAPRQLRPGDAAEVAAIVQNFTAVAGRAAIELVLHDDTGTKGQDLVAMSKKTAEVEIPAGGQVRVPFTIRADAAGEAKFELRAQLRAGEGVAGRDAVKLALPVTPERTLTEKVAMYGSLADDKAIAIPVVMPGAVRRDVGGVSVSASSSLLGGLEDAADALLTYPYGCVEQTSSRLLPVVSLLALHSTYPLGLREDPQVFVKAGVERILSMQTGSGGFAYWPGGNEVHAYASAYATWVLDLAKRAGHPVPADALERAHDDLARRLPPVDQPQRWARGEIERHALALHVLADADRPMRAHVDALFVRRAELPAYGRAFLLMAMHRADPQRPEVVTLTQELLADLEELPATAHVIERDGYAGGEYFHSDGRSDAIILSALLRVRPDHAVIEKLARGLLERRIGGAWRNTQENAYALVAITDYARVREADPPDFVGRAWVGRKPVFEASFLGRDLKGQEATAKMPDILKPTGADQPATATPLTVTLQRQGQGRMYYRLGAEWAPAEPNPAAREHGLELRRELRLADGALNGRSIAIGDAVAIDLTLAAHTRIRYVALEIPLPSGLEAVQLNLGKGQAAGILSGPRGWWASHEELRSDRVLVFADDLPPGTHRHTVFLRATSRGDFSLPPARAEAMYMPEVWGRSEGARVTVR
ncbi:Ig-like domain-containing alpha-2-macroglobulin family protein [Nannocystis bainbridge]|uniref:MG2 domain-containing protein n=1 Tax=Nannocystis bainbridge TaxID=2995303 RepID=A0ABT5EBL2_9BACT|nr:Ig-like domain-containing alpha-2-macroglobulin family protein [Nannocystis bainbridge]MDC0723246.1 MG2 domain-containing protein [Nannocystis bainbridge]